MNHNVLSPKQEISSPQIKIAVGATAVLEPNSSMRTEIVDGFTVRTNLPEGFLPFEPTAENTEPKHPFNRSILPSAVDALPAGEFTVEHPDNPHPLNDRHITITEYPDGKRINGIAGGLFNNIGRPVKLMTALGYIYKPDYAGRPKLESVPTPQTLKEKAGALGVDVQLIPDQGHLDDDTYLGAFYEGKYPVSTASAKEYTHDTQDDHLTAMILGGEPLKKALRFAATQGIEGRLDKSRQTGGIDNFTAHLRATVSPSNNDSALTHSPQTLDRYGKAIGLSSEVVMNILATAQINAAAYGMTVTEYPVVA